MGSHSVAQASLELLASSEPSTLASQSAETTGMSHHAWPFLLGINYICSYGFLITSFFPTKLEIPQGMSMPGMC